MKPIDPSFWVSYETIAEKVAEFIGATLCDEGEEPAHYFLDGNKSTPEIWADYGSYDWVAFCQLFGAMVDLPSGFPMYINDIQQERRRLGVELPEQASGHHNALKDARHVRSCYEFLQNAEQAK